MKKLFFAVIFLVFFGFLAFTDTSDQEEVDYLLFALNSSNRFENEGQASIQLDNLANYLTGRNLRAGQIHVYGYSAAAANDIDPVILSRDRASFVINELIKRGVPGESFSDPVGYGSVDLWGSNTNEGDKIPNRRVRIVLNDNIITPNALQVVDSGARSSNTNDTDDKETITQEKSRSERNSKLPWIILLALFALIAALLLSRFRKNAKASKTVAENQSGIIFAPIAAPVVNSRIVVNLDDEIRNRAYELYQQRNGQSEDAVADWHTAVSQICARYEADGYQTYAEDGSWWACRSTT
jgi:hypothetical protein